VGRAVAPRRAATPRSLWNLGVIAPPCRPSPCRIVPLVVAVLVAAAGWRTVHAAPIGQTPQTPSTGVAARQISVLWCNTQPLALYIVLAVTAPVTLNSFAIWIKGSCISERLVTSAGQ